MDEQLLQYIWQYRLYVPGALQTLCGKEIVVLSPGNLNRDQGPDFLHARIRINGTEWAGHVELHVLSSDWQLHGHDQDPHYSNVILHVVWQHNREVLLPFPTLVLRDYTTLSLLQRYVTMHISNEVLPCASLCSSVPDLIIKKSLERTLIDRLDDRSDQILTLLKKHNGDWDLICWMLIAKSLGGNINGFAFEQMIQAMPATMLKRLSKDNLKTEACFLGLANMLEGTFTDEYPNQLQEIFHFEKQKYKLPQLSISVSYFRMRPSGFPTLRMSMLAGMLTSGFSMSALLSDSISIAELRSKLSLQPSSYWNHHYRFDRLAKKSVSFSLSTLQDLLIVNACAPVIYAYGRYLHNSILQESSIELLTSLQAENNRIVRHFSDVGICAENTAESQGIIQLYKEYCMKKRCLQCGIGLSVLKKQEI